MARRMSADCGSGYQSKRGRALASTNSFEFGDMACRSRKNHLGPQSDESAESDRDERSRHAVESVKQRKNKTRRRPYDAAAAGTSDEEDFARAQSQKQTCRKNKRYRSCKGSCAGAHKPRYANNSDSASETELETPAETSNTTCSSKSSQRRRIGAKRRSLDDMVYNSDYLGYKEYKRGAAGENRCVAASEECIPLIADQARRKYKRSQVGRREYFGQRDEADFQLTKITTASGASNAKPVNIAGATSSANEVLQLMNNLLRTFGNDNSATKMGSATGLRDAAAEKIAQIIHDTMIESKPPEYAQQYAAPVTHGAQKSFPQQLEYETRVTTIETPRMQYPTANGDVNAETGERGADPEQSGEYMKRLYRAQSHPMSARPETEAQPQLKRYMQVEVPKMAAPSQPPLPPPTQFISDYDSRQQPLEHAFPSYLPPSTPAKFAPTSFTHESIHRSAQPQHLAAQRPSQAHISTPTMQPLRQPQPTPPTPQCTLQQRTRQTILLPIPSLNYSDQNGILEYVLSRSAPAPDQTLASDTYVTPQPTQLNKVDEIQGNGELSMPRKSTDRHSLNANQGQRYPNYAMFANGAVAAPTPHTSLLSGSYTRPMTDAYSIDVMQHPTATDRVEKKLAVQENIQNFNYTSTNGKNRHDKRNSRDSVNDNEKAAKITIRAEYPKVVPQSSELQISGENKLHAAGETNGNENINETNELHRERTSKRNKHAVNMEDRDQDRLDESKSAKETNSSCSSDFMRECLRKKRQKKKPKYEKNHRTNNEKRKHYRKQSSSEESSNGYTERGRHSKKGRRRRHYEPSTSTGSESDDEMDYGLSRTSCKAIKKCCSRIVAIYRMPRATAGTQTDECRCDCERDIKKAPNPEVSKSEDDIQRTIIDCLTNTNLKEVLQIMALNRDKKCKVCTCGIVGEDGAPLVKNDMIILKFAEENAAEQRRAEQARLTNRASKCKVSDTESEIRAMITKKRVHEKTQRSMAKSSSSFCGYCACADEQEAEREFVEDLLRKQRCDRKPLDSYEDCVCDCASKAKELAADIMKDMINSHMRAMCAERLVNTNCFADTCPIKPEHEIVSMDSAKTVASLSNRSESGCTCVQKKDSQIIGRKMQPMIRESVTSRKSTTRAGSCTCSVGKNEKVQLTSTERKRVCPTVSARVFKTAATSASSMSTSQSVTYGPSDDVDEQEKLKARRRSVVDKETSTSSVGTCTCEPKKKEVEARRASTENSVISKAREDKIHERAGDRKCKPSKLELEALRTKSMNSQKATGRATIVSSEEGVISRATARGGQNELPVQRTKIRRVMGRETKASSQESVNRNARVGKSSGRAEAQITKPAQDKRVMGSEAGGSGVQQKPSHSADHRSRACRPDCACREPSLSASEPCKEYITEKRRDFNAKTKIKAMNIVPEEAKRHSSKAVTKGCRSGCACKEVAESDTEKSVENVMKSGSYINDRIVERSSNVDLDTSEEDDSIREQCGQKSVQKFIIDIKASKKARASCTLVTYPKNNKNSEHKTLRSKTISDLSSNSSLDQNEQRARLCAELTMNELLPEHSLRTLLTKLSSPNGKLCYADDQHALPAENMRIFTLDQNKLLNLKSAANGKLSSQIGFQPLLAYSKSKAKSSNSAPSLTTSQVLTATVNTRNTFQRLEQAEIATRRNSAKTSSSTQIAVTARMQLPGASHLSGCSDQSTPLSNSESAEARANTRPVINQTSDSNHHIMRLWPDQKATESSNQQKELRKLKPTTHAVSSRQHFRQQLPVDMSAKSQSTIQLAKGKFGHRDVRPRLESGTHVQLQNNASIDASSWMPRPNKEVKKNRQSSPAENVPLKIINILAAANRRPSTKESSESKESNIPRQKSKHQGALTKSSTEQNWSTSVVDSAHSLSYVDRLHSSTMIPTGLINKSKNRVTRFYISDDEQTESDVEYISQQYGSSDSDWEYQVDLERKKELWRKGTVREALEVEEESERARNLQRTTLTGECLERAIHYPTRVWNEERRQLNSKRNSAGIFGNF